MAELFGWLRRAAGHDGETVVALERAVLAQFDRDRLELSDVLEPSFACDAEGAHLYRFSYAFPRLREDREGVEASVRALCNIAGPFAEEAGRTVLRVARSRAVEQILFGYAHDGAGRVRVKLYLQFSPREATTALAIAERMLGSRPNDFADRGPLHLLCLDLGPTGLAGAKLYFVMDRLRRADLERRVGRVPLLEALDEMGVAELRDVLAIYRVAAPDERVTSPAEVDFSLAENDLRWEDVRALAPVRAHLARSPEIEALAATFRLAMRRVSGSVGGPVGERDKLNVYYGLAETDGGGDPKHAG